ncbi:MAG: hypothetical protein ACLRVT_04540 [Oscillospiraceae bacterium]
MKNSTIISIVALLVAVAGAAIGLAAFFKKRSAKNAEDSAFEFPFDDACDCCCCGDEDELLDEDFSAEPSGEETSAEQDTQDDQE